MSATIRAIAPQPPRREEVLGVALAVSDYEHVIDWLESWIDAGGRGYMSAAAVHLVMLAQEQADVMDAVRQATLVVPDGQPLVWALRALGHRGGAASRVYGPELMLRCCERAQASGRGIYLYGGRDEQALALLTQSLQERFPRLRIAGGFSPPFTQPTPEEDAHTAALINASGADIVWVGTGQPKQELWMARMRPRLEAAMLIGVGAAFDFHAGLVPQAPAWMQRAGLEWVFRLTQEPRRLWRRYVRYNPRFVAQFARQYSAARRRR